MQRVAGGFIYSASDLHNDLECRRLTWLESRLAHGLEQRPGAAAEDAAATLIAGKGFAHEGTFLDTLRAEHGDAIVTFGERVANTREAMFEAEAQTLAAMASGAPVIYQATFFDGTFLGRADFLRRVETPSARWAWSYEVIDTKLALQPKAHFLLQLCNYSEHVARLQGSAPIHGHLVLGTNAEIAFRVADYAAYYRHQKRQFLLRAEQPQDAYPAEIGHCAVCRWAEACEDKREADDYLGIVAWMRAGQIARLQASGITTLAALAHARDDQRPPGMTAESFATLRAQAALQHRQRLAEKAPPPAEQSFFYDLLATDATSGFSALPPPAAGDIYFDMEGDPLYRTDRSLEYLFGVHLGDDGGYRAFWAHDLKEERSAFEQFIDFVVARRARYPEMHVYHYAPYETVALRRLMGVYGTREAELDALLTNEVFVDLYAVVRQAVRISQPSYSIKKLEPFYGMVRTTQTRRGDDSIVNFEKWLISRDPALLADIEKYNDDDCRSTWLLHNWLLERRAERIRGGHEVPWRAPKPPADIKPKSAAEEYAERFLAGLPDFHSERDLREADEQTRVRWLLGNLLQYHRREAKPGWWDVFDRRKNQDRLIEFDHEAIGGLTLDAEIPGRKIGKDRNLVYTYDFPDQLYNLGHSDPQCPHAEITAGKVIAIHDDRHQLEIKLSGKIRPNDLHALIPGPPIDTKPQREAIESIAATFQAGTMRTAFPAIYDIVSRGLPRRIATAPGAALQPAAITGEAIADLVRSLDASYLFVQGPPGSGKSTTGGRAIALLLQAGLRVGIVSRGYAAVQNLLHKVEESALASGYRFTGLHRHSGDDNAYASKLSSPMVANTTDNDAFVNQAHQLAAGTPWLFSRPDLAQSYDVLFIDEAGQLSLGDAIACAVSARNVVLLGDPLQLAQVSQGSHPIGTGSSVLDHLLGDEHTVPPDRGVFLPTSYRMHPGICDFISRTVYDGRLHAAPATTKNAVTSPGISGAGLRYVPVAHRSNSRESPEEAERIADEVDALLRGRVTLGNAPERSMTMADVLIVTPYNAQKNRILRMLKARGHGDVKVGTVDKFQGQEAAVVFYSMATSSADEMPRDMSFLFEKNRFNVAVSRAQCLSVLVCSPDLLEVPCKTPNEMLLASLLCAYVEAATIVSAPQMESLQA